LGTTEGTFFNIEGLESATDYAVNVSGDNKSGTDLVFNYCTFVEGTEGAFGVYRTVGDKSKDIAVASKQVSPLSSENIRDANDDSKTVGVRFTQKSSTDCKESTKYSMTTELYCKESVTGAAEIRSATLKDDCEFVVVADHQDGCPGVDIDKYMGWLEDNQWCIGIIYVVFGPIIALFGQQLFPIVCAALVAIFILGLVVSISLAFGWMVSTTGTIVVLVVGLLLGVIAGALIKRHIWLMVSLLGLIGGFFLGALVFSMIAAASGWSAVWGWWVINIAMAIIGAITAYKLGSPVVLLGTSFIGSYLFMRAWTLFFPGHYPSESEIMSNPEELELDSIFWVFVGVFAFCFLTSACVQSKRAVVHEDLDKYSSA